MMGFTALKQYGLNTNLTVICTECDNPWLALFTCGTNVSELTGYNKDLSQLHIRGDLTCSVLAEKFYNSPEYDVCCCHCGLKRKLFTDIDHYPICNLRKC